MYKDCKTDFERYVYELTDRINGWRIDAEDDESLDDFAVTTICKTLEQCEWLAHILAKEYGVDVR